MYKVLLCSLLVMVAFCAEAKIQSDGQVFSPEKGLDLSASFEAQRNAILVALRDGKTYVEISPADMNQVRESLDRISVLLDGKGGVGELQESAKVEVFNRQEQINTLLTQAHQDSRLVCKREKQTGSNRPTNTCLTVAERRRIREDSYYTMKNMRHSETPTTDR